MDGNLIVKGATIVTMDPRRTVIEDGEIAARDGKITYVGPRRNGSDLSDSSVERLDAAGKVVFPGIINTHTHIFQTLVRGVGQDKPVWEWFSQSIDPVVDAISEQDAYLASKLGAIEAIKCGTTTILDYNYPNTTPGMADRTIDAFAEVGIRGILARSIIDTGTVHQSAIHSTREEMEACERLLAQHAKHPEEMIRIWLAPYTIFSTSREALIQAKELADRYGAWLTMHAATPSTIQASMDQYGMDDLSFEDSIGFLGPNVLAVHCCAPLPERTLDLLKDHDTKVSHNPVSNCYLAEGIAPIAAMIRKGIKVSLGSDGPASNNNHDMIYAMKLAALLQKVAELDPTAISSMKILEMATIDGSECVGMDSIVGSIEVGKRADVMIVDFDRANTAPSTDPVASLVYSATQENVETVVVNGRIVMEQREMKSINEHEVISQAREAGEKLLERAFVTKNQ